MSPDQLVTALSSVIHPQLAQSIIDEFVELEEAFMARKWKAAELDGGRFAELASRIVYSTDSGNVSLTKDVDSCLKYIDNEQVSHSFPERQASIHLAKVLRAIYKLRSQRGAVHVTPHYTANEIDSRLILEMVRWTLAELLRIFVSNDREAIAQTIKELAQFPFPLIRMFGDEAFLQATNFTTEEEILAHLFFAADGLTQRELTRIIPKDQSGVSRAIKKLQAAKSREIKIVNDKLRLTDIGMSRIENRLAQETLASR